MWRRVRMIPLITQSKYLTLIKFNFAEKQNKSSPSYSSNANQTMIHRYKEPKPKQKFDYLNLKRTVNKIVDK